MVDKSRSDEEYEESKGSGVTNAVGGRLHQAVIITNMIIFAFMHHSVTDSACSDACEHRLIGTRL